MIYDTDLRNARESQLKRSQLGHVEKIQLRDPTNGWGGMVERPSEAKHGSYFLCIFSATLSKHSVRCTLR